MCEGLIDCDLADLSDEDLGLGIDFESGDLRDRACRLSDYLRVDRAALRVEDDRAELGHLLLVEEVGTHGLELLLDLVVDVLVDDDRLLAGAYDAVVEGLRHQDRGDRHLDVGALVDEGGGVSCTDADCRLSGGVGALDHSRTARGKDQVHQRMVHEEVRLVHRGLVDPGDDVLGGSCRDGCVTDDACGIAGALLRPGMRAEDDRVPGLEGDEGLEDGRTGRVGGRDDAADDALGLRDLLDSESGILLDDAACLVILVLVEDVLCGEVVLDDLVLDDAHSRLLYGILCQGDAGIVGCDGCCAEDLVDLLL